MAAPLNDTSKDAWTTVVAHRDDVLIEDFEIFRNYIVVTILENGLTQMEVIDRKSGETKRVAFDEDVYVAYADDNYEFDTDLLRYTYESLTTPESTYDYNLATESHTLIKEEVVVGDFDRSNYQTERLFATARDGAQVPVSIVYRKGLQKERQESVAAIRLRFVRIQHVPVFQFQSLKPARQGLYFRHR